LYGHVGRTWEIQQTRVYCTSRYHTAAQRDARTFRAVSEERGFVLRHEPCTLFMGMRSIPNQI
jgi:hypothetical protein